MSKTLITCVIKGVPHATGVVFRCELPAWLTCSQQPGLTRHRSHQHSPSPVPPGLFAWRASLNASAELAIVPVSARRNAQA